MRDAYVRFTSLGAQIYVVAPHGAEEVRTFWLEYALPFIGLPDPDGRLADLYGQEWNAFRLGRMPALLVLDAERRVVLAHYGKSMGDIPTEDEVLEALGEKKGAGT